MRITADPTIFGDRSEMSSEEFQSLISGGPSLVPPALVDAVPDWQTNEKAFMAKVVKYATDHGWESYHTHTSANSAPGFPDLVMVRVQGLYGRIEVAELKVGRNRPTKAQQQWLSLLRLVSETARTFGYTGIGVRVWTPADWDEIEEVLR